LAEEVGKGKKIVRYDLEKREMYEATMSKDVEETRDFYPATDEKIAAARIHARKLVEKVRNEEVPKKEKIWKRVWEKYGDESMLFLSVLRHC
jgi:hypothetical protein